MYLARLVKMPPAEKIQRMLALSNMAAQFVLGGIRERYPNADLAELKIRYAAITCGRDFVVQHFNWDPEIKGY